MRVLTVGNMYPPHHLGGYELMWRSSVRRWRDAGDEVRVLTTDHRRPDPDRGIGEDPDVARELRWYWRDHDFPRFSARQAHRLERHNLAVLDRELSSFEPDAIAWWAMGGMSMSLLERGRRAGLPAVGVVVDEWLVYGPRVDAWRRGPGRSRLLGHLAGVPSGFDLGPTASWLFASEYLRERAAAARIDIGVATVAHPGIEAGRFEPAPPREWNGRLLCLGRIDRRKGVATVIEALGELPECSLRCVGAGDPEHLAELEGLASRSRVQSRVGFDRVDRAGVPGVLAAADALCFCVEWPEPFGIAPLEAMAMGVPVIATATGGSAEYLEHERNCLVVEPGDPRAVAAAVKRLGADPGLRERLRAAGLETAAAHPQRQFDDAVRAALEAAAWGPA